MWVTENMLIICTREQKECGCSSPQSAERHELVCGKNGNKISNVFFYGHPQNYLHDLNNVSSSNMRNKIKKKSTQMVKH